MSNVTRRLADAPIDAALPRRVVVSKLNRSLARRWRDGDVCLIAEILRWAREGLALQLLRKGSVLNRSMAAGGHARTRHAALCAATAVLSATLGGITIMANEPDSQATDIMATFLSEYPAHAARLRGSLANIHCKFSASTMHTTPKKVDRHVFRGDFYAKGESREEIRLYAVDEHLRGHSEVICVTAHQTFDLRKPAPDATYVIDSFDDTGDKQRRERGERRAFLRVNSILNAAFEAFDLPITVLLERGTVRTIRNIQRDGETLLEASFSFEPGKYYKNATVLLDPRMDYAIREYDFEGWPTADGRPGDRRKGTVRCQKTKDGFIVPKHASCDGWSVDAVGKRLGNLTWEYDIEVVSSGDVDDRQFTLAAFGLPAVTLKRGLRLYPLDRWYFWALLVTGVIGWFYLRKKTRPLHAGDAAA